MRLCSITKRHVKIELEKVRMLWTQPVAIDVVEVEAACSKFDTHSDMLQQAL